MSDNGESERKFTRRQILKGVPIGLAGIAALGVFSGRAISKFARGERMPKVPRDSIFAPDKIRYPEA